MQKTTAKLYFNGMVVADIDEIQYSTPFFTGRLHFADPQFAELMARISAFGQSRYWLTVCNYAPDILPLLSSDYGTAFARNETGIFERENLEIQED